MFLNPYQTTTLARLNLDKVRSELEMSHAEGNLEKYPATSMNLFIIAGRSPHTDLIPSFYHPLEFEWGIVIDVRSYGPYPLRRLELGKDIDLGPGRTEVNAAVLQSIWQESEGTRRELSGISPLPLQVFGTWFGEAIARLIGADPQTQIDLCALCAWFYLSMHIGNDEKIDSNDELKYARRVSSATFCKMDRAAELIGETGLLRSLPELVEAIHKLPSTRTDNVSLVNVITAINGGWWGTPVAKEQLIVALEYPPLFLSILFTVTNEKMFSKSVLRETAQRFDRRGKFDEYANAFLGVIRSASEL